MSASVKKQNNNEKQEIVGFEGYYNFLSNDYPTWVYFQGIKFPSVSTAFQATRTDDVQIRQKIANVTDIEQFKNIAMSIKNPSDWSERKEKVMENLVRDKFKRNKEILEKLIGTKDKKIINNMKNSGFNEQYWGVYNGKGKNVLGRILMNIRQQFNKGIDTKQWIENNLSLESDKNMLAKVSILVMKDGKKMQRLNLDKGKNYYLFGSLKTVDFLLENPTISRNHACIYFDNNIEVMIVDLNSTHKTFLRRKVDGQEQKIELEGLINYRLHKDDVLQFGTSNREYIVDIDRSEVEKYIREEQSNLKQNAKEIPHKLQHPNQFEKMSKSEVKNMLGLQRKCLMVEGLRQSDSYSRLKEYFGKFEKIKNVRLKINVKTGRNQGVGVIFFENNASVGNIIGRKKQVQYKIKAISQQQAQSILNSSGNERARRSRSRSRDRSKQKQRERQRSREKKQRKRENY